MYLLFVVFFTILNYTLFLFPFFCPAGDLQSGEESFCHGRGDSATNQSERWIRRLGEGDPQAESSPKGEQGIQLN